MQMIDGHVVVVVGSVVVVVVVVVLRGVGVVVVVVGGAVLVVVVVVVVVVFFWVVVEDDSDGCDDDVELPVAGVEEPADCDAGGIGSTAPSSDGLGVGPSWPSVPMANNVQTTAPTTAPMANRPCPCCRVDPIGSPSGESSDHW